MIQVILLQYVQRLAGFDVNGGFMLPFQSLGNTSAHLSHFYSPIFGYWSYI